MAQQQSPQQDPYPRWTKAQKYAAEGFKPVDCFAGQARVRGKRLTRQPFSVFLANTGLKCCGTVVKTARTDQHGHFLVEPMQEGEYFARFDYRGENYVTAFAVIQNYDRCDGTHIEVSFSNPKTPIIKTFVDIDDSGEACQENEPRCYRR